MIALLAGALALIFLIFAFRGIAAADPAVLARILRIAGALVLGALAALMVAGGRLFVAGALGSAALALVGWTPDFLRRFTGGRSASGRRSEVTTELLQMTLDHDSGVMTGRVRAGRFRGAALGDLSADQLYDLLDEARASDGDAAALLETWLDRLGPKDWREAYSARGAAPGPAPSGAAMTREEAYAILGLSPGAKQDQIRQAHRRLMRNFHPDAGGSTYLASKINQAKDLLLG